MMSVVDQLQTLDEYVVHIDLHYPTDLVDKHPFDEALVGDPCIIEVEGHDPVEIHALVCQE